MIHRPAAQRRTSHLFHISQQTQVEVALATGTSPQAVQKKEAKALARLRKALLSDPATLVAIDPELASRHMPTPAKELAEQQSHRVQIGGNYITPDQRRELEYYEELARAYAADGQPETARAIRAEIEDLHRRIRAIPNVAATDRVDEEGE